MRRFIPIVNASWVGLLLVCLVGGSACTLDLFACKDPSPDRTDAYSCDGDAVIRETYRSGGNGEHCMAGTSRTACLPIETCVYNPHHEPAAFCAPR